MKKIGVIILFLSITFISHSQNHTYTGGWRAEIRSQDTSFVLYIGFYHKLVQGNEIVGGSILKPEMIAFRESSFSDSILQLESAKRDIKFKGSLTPDKNKMSGFFTYRGKVYPVDLRRGEKVILRPQEPKKPFPYISEEIKFTNKRDSVRLGGTLTVPNKEGYYPAVILISGSTPSDRDGESNYHKRQLVLADYLTRIGIAVLRYDSRGVNESTGDFNNSTAEDFAYDVLAGYDLLCGRKEIDKQKIGLIGQSAGGLVASIAASINSNIGFIILMASPGIEGKDDFLLQTDLKLNGGDLTPDQHAFMKEFYNKYYTLLEQGYDKKVMTDSLLKFNDKFNRYFIPAGELNTLRHKFLEPFMVLMNNSLSPNFRFLVLSNPSVYFEKVTCPVLSLNGSKDIFVPAQLNQNAIRKALTKGGNPDFTVLELEGLNHSFQECETGSIKESLEIEQTISPKAMSIIAEWISKHSN